MKKPWQIWTLFLLCLAIVVPAMGWLTVTTIRLDALRETDRRETELARREAELQERLSSALYRMDLKMLPLVAQEASRPHYFYQPFYQVANSMLTGSPAQDVSEGEISSQTTALPSPLLFQSPEFVLLHFQIDANKNISSPQRPVGIANDLAFSRFGISQEEIDQNELRLRLAASEFDYGELLDECPALNLPQVPLNPKQQMASQNVYSVPAAEKIQQIIEQAKQSGVLSKGDLNPQQYANKAEVQRSRGTSRVNTEFSRRRDSTLEFADQQWQSNNMGMGNQMAFAQPELVGEPSDPVIREGVMQPIWQGENLILARRVDGPDQPVVQVCWLDWTAIQETLKAEVADLLPQVEFEPVRQDSDLKLGTALTTLPVQLVVDNSSLLSTLAIDSPYDDHSSGLRISLWVAWIGLGLAAIATASLLYGVIRLSERRATFVSAVTHELRTPLTTFRMYAEMLAEKMVPPGKQQEYANTLKVQADRLTHLVENVLQFARLERGADQKSNVTLTVDELMSRFTSRLAERAADAGMDLSIRLDPNVGDVELATQPSTIEQILFNLVDNACKYAGSSDDKRIEIVCQVHRRQLRFCVRDHGPGVAPEYKRRMFQPFCKSDQDAANSAAGVGLGLALCRRMATSVGGRLFYEDSSDQCVGSPGAMFVFEIPTGR